MERRRSSRHAVPAIPWALGGKHNSTVAHDVPHTHPRERRASFGEALGRAPTALSDALEHWQAMDAARGRLYEARLEATFDDEESEEAELERPFTPQELERASTARSSLFSPGKGGEGPHHDPYLVTWESTHSEHENPRTWTYRHKMGVLAMYAAFSGIGPWASSMASPAVRIIRQDLHFTTTSESQLIIAIFVLALVFGPLFSAPISETIGRRKIVLFCNPVYVCALTQVHRVQHRVHGVQDARADDRATLLRRRV